jgi:hypothetical protein
VSNPLILNTIVYLQTLSNLSASGSTRRQSRKFNTKPKYNYNMRILITGAAGFVGMNLTAKLLREGRDVVAADSLARAGADWNVRWLRSLPPRLRFERRTVDVGR